MSALLPKFPIKLTGVSDFPILRRMNIYFLFINKETIEIVLIEVVLFNYFLPYGANLSRTTMRFHIKSKNSLDFIGDI